MAVPRIWRGCRCCGLGPAGLSWKSATSGTAPEPDGAVVVRRRLAGRRADGETCRMDRARDGHDEGPHRWLEDVTGPAALDGVRARNAETVRELAGTGRFAELRASIRQGP